MDASTRKLCRRLGHRLNPAVTVGERGLEAGVRRELDAALERHELLKVRINEPDRERRRALVTDIAAQHGCEVVQTVGKVALLYRPATRPNPNTSNLLRGAC